MREILFRGKRVDNGKWAYGYYFIDDDEYVIFDNDPYEGTIDFHDVDPKTVGQFTGLTDNSGVKIFEGDIVEYEDEVPGQVEYHDSTFMNRGQIGYADGMFYWTNPIAIRMTDTVYKGTADCTVIGNIYDNPELMEEESR